MHRKCMKFECLLVELLFVGIGAGASAVLFGEISRTTTQKERTAAFTVVIAISELGLIVGPALNLFLQHLDYKVGPFVLDKYTSPGVRQYSTLVCGFC